MPFPEEGLVYDYCLDDGGISKFNEDEGEEISSGSEVEDCLECKLFVFKVQ